MAKKEAETAKTKTGKLKAKLLDIYYGHPAKDMKLIIVTGASDKVEVANYVHEILKAAGQPVAILASEQEIKVGALHKFLSTAWKAGSNYCVITAPDTSLKNDVFYGLPVHIAALTNSGVSRDESILFKMNPIFVVINRDDANFEDFSNYAGSDGTILYGNDRSSHIAILRSKTYKYGTEASLSIGNNSFTVASFLTNENTTSNMAAAAAIADALHITPEKISEGIANYDPADVSEAK